MLKTIIAVASLTASGAVLAGNGTIGFTGRVLAPSCEVSLAIGAADPSVSCHYTLPPRVEVRHHPEPQLLVAREDTVYVITYN